MTRSIAAEVELRQLGIPQKPRNFFDALARALIARSIELGQTGAVLAPWPSAKYRDDPVRFFLEVLGVDPWSRQIEMIEAIRDNPRVAIRSGHKVAKSNTLAGIALWFFSSFDDARVVMSSTTARQVDKILWRELRIMHARAKQKLDGTPAEKANTGLVADDFREIVGFTAREAEAVAGVSGKNLLYLVDEASGVPDLIFEAIEGNRAGGARIVMVSNPTRTEGEFFDAFFEKSKHWRTLTISSEESPNVVAGRDVIPGLATRSWIDEKKDEWGEDSPLYKIRVKGEHVLAEDGKILTASEITMAEDRWEDVEAKGVLSIGVDPAGDGDHGDDSGFAVRRGSKVLLVLARRGLSEDAHLEVILGLIQEHKIEGERPRVIVDSDGAEGAKVYSTLVGYLHRFPENFMPFELYRIRGSEKSPREQHIYALVRDALWANVRKWIREGGAIPQDAKLAKELHAPEWIGQLDGRVKATGKRDLKKRLGRSPDRADALVLSVWEPVDHFQRIEEERAEANRAREEHFEEPPALDPYSALDAFRR